MEKANNELNADLFLKGYEQLMLLSHDLMAVLGPEGDFQWVNPSWNKIFSFETGELLGKSFIDFLHAGDIAGFKEKLANLLHTGDLLSFESKFVSKDQSYRWILWEFNYLQDQGLIYLAGKDITQRKLAEEEINLIQRLISSFTAKASLSDLLNLVVSGICKISGFTYGEAWIMEQTSKKLLLDTSWTAEEEIFTGYLKDNTGITLDYNNSLVGKVWESGQVFWIEDLQNEDSFNRKEFASSFLLNSAVFVPVKSVDTVVSVIGFFSREYKPHNRRFVSIISTVSAQMGALIERRQFEEKLVRSERLLNETQKIANVGSWELDVKSNRIYWSDEMFDIFGIEHVQFGQYEKIANRLIHSERIEMENKINQILTDHHPFRFEFKYLHPGGSIRVLSSNTEVILDANSQVQSLIGTVQDITSLKESEEKLRKSEEYYRSLIENALDVKTILDEEGIFKYISPSIERVLGYKPGELVGKNIIRFIHYNDITLLIEVFNKIVKRPGLTVSVEFRIKDKLGVWHNVESIMRNLLENSAVRGIVVNSRDITSRKEAENTIQALLTISKKLNSTLNVDSLMDALPEEAMRLTTSECAMAGLRTHQDMVTKKYFNEAGQVEFEHSWPAGKGIPGRLIESRVPYTTNQAQGDQYVKNDILAEFNIRSAAYVPILDTNDEVIGFLGVMNKKNEQGFSREDREKLIALSQAASTSIQNALAYQKIKAAEYQLKNSREQLRRLSAHLQSAREEERTRIAREIHDELGQAMTGLKMDLSWMEKRIVADGSMNEVLQEKVNAMYSLINETIKSIRKISSELRPGVLDYLGLAPAIEWQAQDFQSRTGISCNIISIPKELELDQNTSTGVFRIFQETLTNIMRHANASRVTVSLKASGGNLILSVRDNGRGITEQEIVNSKSLGLLGMRERAYLLGGEFKIEGSRRGTKVTVKVPIANSKEIGEGK